jgi:hypothetical protein
MQGTKEKQYQKIEFTEGFCLVDWIRIQVIKSGTCASDKSSRVDSNLSQLRISKEPKQTKHRVEN